MSTLTCSWAHVGLLGCCAIGFESKGPLTHQPRTDFLFFFANFLEQALSECAVSTATRAHSCNFYRTVVSTFMPSPCFLSNNASIRSHVAIRPSYLRSAHFLSRRRRPSFACQLSNTPGRTCACLCCCAIDCEFEFFASFKTLH